MTNVAKQNICWSRLHNWKVFGQICEETYIYRKFETNWRTHKRLWTKCANSQKLTIVALIKLSLRITTEATTIPAAPTPAQSMTTTTRRRRPDLETNCGNSLSEWTLRFASAWCGGDDRWDSYLNLVVIIFQFLHHSQR